MSHYTSCSWLWLRPPATNHPGPQLSIEVDVDTVAITAHFIYDGDINNEIGVPCNVEALNLDVAMLTIHQIQFTKWLGDKRHIPKVVLW